MSPCQVTKHVCTLLICCFGKQQLTWNLCSLPVKLHSTILRTVGITLQNISLQTFLQRRQTNAQEGYENGFSIPNHQGDIDERP